MDFNLQTFISNVEHLGDIRNLDPLNPVVLKIEHPMTAEEFCIVLSHREPTSALMPLNGVWVCFDDLNWRYKRAFRLVSKTPEGETLGTWALVETYADLFNYPQTYVMSSNVAGPSGPKGEVGPMGPVGPIGFSGVAGPRGPVGPQGVGSVGPMGPIGLSGLIGQRGPTGVQGLVGDPGLTGGPGSPGTAGLTGPAGPVGTVGPQGVQGVIGDPGVQGTAGTSGTAGAVGPAGPQGVAGPTGPTSPQVSQTLAFTSDNLVGGKLSFNHGAVGTYPVLFIYDNLDRLIPITNINTVTSANAGSVTIDFPSLGYPGVLPGVWHVAVAFCPA